MSICEVYALTGGETLILGIYGDLIEGEEKVRRKIFQNYADS